MVHGLTATQDFYGSLFGWEFQPGPQQLGPYSRALLDGYEPGMRTAQLEPLMTRLRDELGPLVAELPEGDPARGETCLHGEFPIERQRRLQFVEWLAWLHDSSNSDKRKSRLTTHVACQASPTPPRCCARD